MLKKTSKRIFSLFFLFSIIFSLISCSKSTPLASSALNPAVSEFNTFSELELQRDLDAQFDAEDLLWETGIVFLAVGGNSWDWEYYDDALVSSQVSALKNFIHLSSLILSKYGNGFLLENVSGTSESHLSPGFVSELQQKIDLSEEALEFLSGPGHFKTKKTGQKSSATKPAPKRSGDVLN